ncbi:MAG: hypothetical protein ACM3ZC_12300 [Bacteroidota bacterium]
MKRGRWLALAIALAMLPPIGVRPQAADELRNVLKKVQTALDTTFYKGLLVTVKRVGTGREEEVAKAWFGPRGQQALEIITPTWRGGESLIVDGVNSWVYYPDCGAVLKLAAKRENRVPQTKGAQLEGTGRLGDRRALILRWEGQFGLRRIWLDAEKYVPLKREDKNARGELILSQSLQEVEFLSAPPLERFRFAPDPGLMVFTDEAAFHQAVSLAHVQRGVDYRIRMPEFLPSGIVFDRALLRQLPQLTVIQVRFGDKKDKVISLFEYRTSQVLVPPERQFLAEAGGGREAKLNFYRWRAGGLDLVLVGNLPLDVLREIAKSVK